MRGEDAAAALAERVADHLEGRGHRFDAMTKREAVIAAVRVLTDDIGAAQHFCQTIGLDVDLYTADLSHVDSSDNDTPAVTQPAPDSAVSGRQLQAGGS